MDEPHYETCMFKLVQPLFQPRMLAPFEKGKNSVNLQFIIPGLQIASEDKDNYNKLIRNCINDVWGSQIQELKNNETDAKASFIEIAFYIDHSENEGENQQIMENRSRIIIERLLGVISFCAGMKVSAINVIPTMTSGPSYQMVLHPKNKTERPKIKFSIPQELIEGRAPSSEIFTALFWLRRGLAEHDPIDTYNAFMVCLQILARNWWDKKLTSGCVMNKPQARKCPYCENELPLMEKCPKCDASLMSEIPPTGFLFREYITTEFGVSRSKVKKVWGLRNAIAAHGNKIDIDADDFIGLTELKFDAANWAYQGINRALGLTSDSAPKPSQDFFMTDALMNLD